MSDKEKLSGMVNITGKPDVLRRATATGSIFLNEPTITAILSGSVKKGDVFTTARLAAILAVKDTPRLITLCHPIQISGIDVYFETKIDGIKVRVMVTSIGKTGVEMEALTGVIAALLNIWDMVKYLEKDETGNYPNTRIQDIFVIEKEKGSV